MRWISSYFSSSPPFVLPHAESALLMVLIVILIILIIREMMCYETFLSVTLSFLWLKIPLSIIIFIDHHKWYLLITLISFFLRKRGEAMSSLLKTVFVDHLVPLWLLSDQHHHRVLDDCPTQKGDGWEERRSLKSRSVRTSCLLISFWRSRSLIFWQVVSSFFPDPLPHDPW